MAVMVNHEGTLSRTLPDTWVQTHNLIDRGACDQLGEKIWQLVQPVGTGPYARGSVTGYYISDTEKVRLFP